MKKRNDLKYKSMLERYDFDEDAICNIIAQIDLDMQKLKLEQEQKEYEEMNYISLYKRMNRYSIGELLGQLIQCILCTLSVLVKKGQED